MVLCGGTAVLVEGNVATFVSDGCQHVGIVVVPDVADSACLCVGAVFPCAACLLVGKANVETSDGIGYGLVCAARGQEQQCWEYVDKGSHAFTV